MRLCELLSAQHGARVQEEGRRRGGFALQERIGEPSGVLQDRSLFLVLLMMAAVGAMVLLGLGSHSLVHDAHARKEIIAQQTWFS